jgi:hypothetical protein
MGWSVEGTIQIINDSQADEVLARLGWPKRRTLSAALWKYADPDIPIFQEAKAEYAKLKQGGTITVLPRW